ncbi:transcriptional regulator [Sphaerisporangium siamense]|nr:transcriptional regulator [Sphaerisporangium siamense]
MSSGREIDPRESPRALFAYELRRYRQAAGLSQKRLGWLTGYSDSMVNLIELTKRRPTERFAELCDRALALDGIMVRLYAATTWRTAPEYFRPWLEVEEEATALHNWEPMLVPGLLQTQAYARAILATSPGTSGEELDERLTQRMRRQAILGREKPPMISVIVDEAVLHRSIGGAEVMREQVKYLIEIAQHPMVTIQVVPYETEAHCGLAGGFIVAERVGWPYAAYMEAQPHGRTVDEPQTIAALTARYDAIRAEALPFKQSVKLLERVVNQRDR